MSTPGLLIIPALPAVLLVLGLLVTACCGIIAYAKAYLLGKLNGQAGSGRRSAALVVSGLVAALLLFGGVYGIFADRVAALDANLSGSSFPNLSLYTIVLAIGNALWPPLLAIAIGSFSGWTLGSRGRRSTTGVVAGSVLAEMFAFWFPGNESAAIAAAATEPEFEITMASGELIEEEEREYIGNILEMGETTALEVMRPRTDVVALDADWDEEMVMETVAASRHSRFPVYEGNIDNVIGVLHLRNLFEYKAASDASGAFNLRSLLLDCNYVPASRKADDALRDIQQSKGHLAIVLDEFGGTAGILTIEDLLEEIVGEIQDEHDDEAKHVHTQDDGSMIISAQMPIDEVNELLATQFEAEDVETLGGFVTHGLGRIPLRNDSLESEGFEFRVLSVDKNRIGRIRVRAVEPGA